MAEDPVLTRRRETLLAIRPGYAVLAAWTMADGHESRLHVVLSQLNIEADKRKRIPPAPLVTACGRQVPEDKARLATVRTRRPHRFDAHNVCAECGVTRKVLVAAVLSPRECIPTDCKLCRERVEGAYYREPTEDYYGQA